MTPQARTSFYIVYKSKCCGAARCGAVAETLVLYSFDNNTDVKSNTVNMVIVILEGKRKSTVIL